VLLTWEGGALEIRFWQLGQNQADLGWTPTDTEKNAKKRERLFLTKRGHRNKKKKAETTTVVKSYPSSVVSSGLD